MLLAMYRAAGAVLFVTEFAALCAGYLAVCLGSHLVGLDLRFALFKAGSFLRGQRAGATPWSMRFSWVAWRWSIFGVASGSFGATGAWANAAPPIVNASAAISVLLFIKVFL